MHYIRPLFFLGLFLYTVGLLSLDFLQGEFAVRGYFSDIVTDTNYPVLYNSLFGINTSLSVCLLCGCAVLYLVCSAVPAADVRERRLTLFLWSQVLFFLYVAADERLRIHEWLGGSLGIEDAFILLFMGVLEVILLVSLGGLLRQSRQTKIYLLVTALFFALMVVIDAWMPSNFPGRLAAEDLFKLWAIVFLFVYAWCFTMEHLRGEPIETVRKPY